MNLIVIGCGRLGAELAYRLYTRGHQVTVIDITDEAFKNLSVDFRGRTVEGDTLNQVILHRAGIEQADGVAVVTNSDTINAVIGHVARHTYNIPNVVVRNYDSRLRAIYETFDLQVISSTSWGAQRIEELLYHSEMRTVFSAGNGEIELYEFSIPRIWERQTLTDLIQTNQCFAVSVTRAGRAMLPEKEMQLMEGDIVLVSATCDGIEAVRQRLLSTKEG